MRSIRALGAGVALVLGACSTLDAPDQNASTLQELTGSAPTRAAVVSATQGLFAGFRAAGPCLGNCAYIGREGMNLDPSNPQNVPTTYINGGDFAVWTGSYANDKLANLVLAALANVTGMSDSLKTGVKGIAHTIKALDLMYVIQTTDVTGAVLHVPNSATDAIPSVATKAEVYARIFALLDSGYTELTTPNVAFPVTFPAGYAGFTTPAAFARFNRAIKARENVYFGNYAAALTDITAATAGAPFVAAPTTLAQLQVGLYHSYSQISGDATNGTYDATDRQRFSHNANAFDAQLQAGATVGDTTRRDARFLRKVRAVRPAPFNRYNFDVNWAFQVYNSLSDPIPVIRQEELILLRAEANLACTGVAPAPNCAGNRVAALADINTIRTVSGGLTAIADPGVGGTGTGDLLLDELLYNKRYSLLWEGGYTWFDARKYGILDKLNHGGGTGNGPLGQPVQNGVSNQVVFQYARLPDNECNARSIAINAQPAGAGGPCQLAVGR